MVQKYEDIIKKLIKKNHEHPHMVLKNQKKFLKPKLETIFENKLSNLDQIIKIQQTKQALKGFTKKMEISITNNKDP